jgi:hypothetical protein
MPKPEDVNAERLKFLADRAAVLLVVCKVRYGNDWNPFFSERFFDPDGEFLGSEVRDWPEYKTGLLIVRNWIKKFDQKLKEERANGADTDAINPAQATR